MSTTALFIRHQSKLGKPDDVRRVWEKYVKARAAANPSPEPYYFCHDSKDADAIRVFQLYSSVAAMQDFLLGEWYADYLKEVGDFVANPPQISPTNLIWANT
jgi:quinol monooxygenase YgiN